MAASDKKPVSSIWAICVQVPPWCIHLPERSRICHIRSNVGLDWADNVLPNIWRIGARNTDILVGY